MFITGLIMGVVGGYWIKSQCDSEMEIAEMFGDGKGNTTYPGPY